MDKRWLVSILLLVIYSVESAPIVTTARIGGDSKTFLSKIVDNVASAATKPTKTSNYWQRLRVDIQTALKDIDELQKLQRLQRYEPKLHQSNDVRTSLKGNLISEILSNLKIEGRTVSSDDHINRAKKLVKLNRYHAPSLLGKFIRYGDSEQFN